MVSAEQVKSGVNTYINNEIMSKMPSARQFLLGMVSGLVMQGQADGIISAMRDMPVIKMMGIVDEGGNIDIDKLYNAAIEQMSKQGKLQMSIPAFGNFSFNSDDVNKLYNYIKGGYGY